MLLAVSTLVAAACQGDDSDDDGARPTARPTGTADGTTMDSTTDGTQGATAAATAGTAAPTASTLEPGPAGPGCAAVATDDASALTLGEVIAATPELSRFAAAWEQAGTADRLVEDGPITVVAPTDAAFDALDPAVRDMLTADPTGALARVLDLHVVSGDHPLAALTTAGTVSGPAGNLTATDVGGAVLIDSGGGPATVTCRDVVVANGRLHLVDGVLLPPPADTQAVGGSQLFRVDVATGAATSVGAFGEELGVLDVVATDDATLLGLTDSAELITFTPDAPDAPTGRVPVTGVEGATLLGLDQTDDGSLLGVTDLSRLYRIDPATGAATPVGGALDPGIDDLGVAVDADATGLVRLLVATGTDLTVDPVTGSVVATGPPPAFADGAANAGAPARVVAASSWGGELLAVDATTGTLCRLGADGTLTTIGPLDVVLTDGAGLDASPDGTLYLTVPG